MSSSSFTALLLTAAAAVLLPFVVTKRFFYGRLYLVFIRKKVIYGIPLVIVNLLGLTVVASIEDASS